MTLWTSERIEEARALAVTGLSYANIGRRMGCSKNAVVGIAKRNGFPERGSPIGGVPWTQAESDIVRDGVALGLTDSEIAGRLGTRTRASVNQQRLELGLVMDAKAHRRAIELAAFRTFKMNGRKRAKATQNWAWGGQAPERPKAVKALRVIDGCETVPLEPDHAGCSWLVSDRRPWLVCGAPRVGGRRGLCSSYCEAHGRLATAPRAATVEEAA